MVEARALATFRAAILDAASSNEPGEHLTGAPLWLCRGVERAPIAAAILRPDGEIVTVNPAMCALLGRSESSFRELTLPDVSHHDDLARDRRQTDDMLSGKSRSRHVQKRYLRHDGAVVWVSTSTFLARDTNGEPEYFVVLVDDSGYRHQTDPRRFTPLVARLTRIVIIEQQEAFAEALAIALDVEPDLHVAGTATTPWRARELLSSGADVAIIDGAFGSSGGMELAIEFATVFPSVRSLVVSDAFEPRVLEQALLCGIYGFIAKAAPLRELIDSIRHLSDHRMAMSTGLLAQVVEGFRGRESDPIRALGAALLTRRETEILQSMADGLSTKAIAGELFVSVNTVRSHAQNTLVKLGAHSRLEAVAFARAAGLLDLDPAGLDPLSSDLGVPSVRKH